MLSILEINEKLIPLQKQYKNVVKIGIAGSYARGEETLESDLDIVLDGDSMRQDISDKIKELFSPLIVDTLWLDLLKKEDQEADEFCKKIGMPINMDSVYKTIKREVIWIS